MWPICRKERLREESEVIGAEPVEMCARAVAARFSDSAKVADAAESFCVRSSRVAELRRWLVETSSDWSASRISERSWSNSVVLF